MIKFYRSFSKALSRQKSHKVALKYSEHKIPKVRFFLGGGQILKLNRCRPAIALNSLAYDRGKTVLVFGPDFDFRSQPEVTGKNYRHENFDKIK